MVGGGVSGLRLALACLDAGDAVTLIEGKADLGGLTQTQPLEVNGRSVEVDRFYHVVLESDATLRMLLDDLGVADRVLWTSAPAELIADGQPYPASSLGQMATLPALKLTDRMRIGASIAASLALPMKLADRTTSAAWLRRVAGESAYTNFWGPILRAKLGTQADRVSATFIVSTFRRLVQARLKGAGDRFGVIPGGYGPVFEAMRDRFLAAGGEIRTGSPVVRVRPLDKLNDSTVREHNHSAARVQVTLEEGTVLEADRVFLTTPGPVTSKLVPDLTLHEHDQLTTQPYLGVLCATLLLDKPPNDSYITYLTDDVGLTGVIGMHALLPPEHTGGAYLVYLPHYCAPDDPWFDESDEVLHERFLNALKACFPDLQANVLAGSISRARYVVPLPLPRALEPLPFATSIPGIHVVSSAQNMTGTLNVEGTLQMADRALDEVMGETSHGRQATGQRRSRR